MTPAYKMIKSIYGKERTARSGVLLMNHIDEGLKILEGIGASEATKDAYCLHPILQSGDDFRKNRRNDFEGVSSESLIYAMEYRRAANSYLSKGKHSDVSMFVGFSCPEVKQMLIADKVQNFKDFMEYHYETHPNSATLYEYFQNWFDLLKIDYREMVRYIEK
jgi:hypothetical protein